MSNAVLLSLSELLTSRLSAVYKSTQSNLSGTVDDFVSKDATITLNGQAISFAGLVQTFQTEKVLEAAATVTFSGTVEVPANAAAPVTSGSVGTSFTVTIEERFRVRDAPVTKMFNGNIIVFIDKDASIPTPPPSPVRGNFDSRRVKVLDLVIADAPVPSGTV